MRNSGLYKIRTVSTLTGFSPARLRVWERRYKILLPTYLSSGHRMYTEDDLQTLREVRALLQAGRSIGEIARLGRKALLRQPTVVSSGARNSSAATEQAAFHPSVIFPHEPESLAVKLHSELTRCCTTIVEAAIAIDGSKLNHALDYAFAIVSPDLVISQVIEPAARIIGEQWRASDCSVGGEHLMSNIFLYRLRKLVELTSATVQADALPVVCTCFPDEQHELGILICTYHLARRGFRVAYLGQSLPFKDLERICTLLHPAAVYLSVTRSATLRAQKPHLLSLLKRRAGQISFFIGGQGVNRADDAITDAGAVLWRPPWLVEHSSSPSTAYHRSRM